MAKMPPLLSARAQAYNLSRRLLKVSLHGEGRDLPGDY